MKIKQTIVMTMVLLMAFGYTASAQNFNVESVKMELQSPVDDAEKDFDKIMEWLEAAKSHPKTANDPKMWYYRGVAYAKAAFLPKYQKEGSNSSINEDYIDNAYEALKNCIATDAKKKFSNGGSDRVFGSAERQMLSVAAAYYTFGSQEYNAQNFANAFTYFEKTLPLLAYDTEGDLKRQNVTAEQVEKMMGFCAYGANDFKKASNVFNSLVDKGEKDPLVYTTYATVLVNQGDTAKAIEVIEKGKKYNETDKGLINMELDLYLKQGRSEELIGKLDRAIEDDPGNTIYYFARAISYEGLGDLEKAAADYDKILEIDPTYFDAAYNKGVMYLNKVANLVDEMNEKNVYKPSEIAVYEQKINDYYSKAIVQFENVYENNDELASADRLELAKTMKKIYAQLSEMDKYQKMKEEVEQLEAN
jgi:tetratricopeptide (TPR) repeat protein